MRCTHRPSWKKIAYIPGIEMHLVRQTRVLKRIQKIPNYASLSAHEIFEKLLEIENASSLSKDILLDIEEVDAVEIPLRKKYNGKESITRLNHADNYAILALELSTNGYPREGEEIFEAILKRTPEDTTALNNYGIAILSQITKLRFGEEKTKIDKTKLHYGFDLLFKAWKIDQFLHEDPRLMPAYKNLCLIRAVEAIYYFDMGEMFTAFVIGWISIEMTIYRIWYEFLKEVFPKQKQKVDSLMRWSVDQILTTVLLCKLDPRIEELRSDLEILKGTRDGLLHGKISSPTRGEARRCIDVAYRMIPIRQ